MIEKESGMVKIRLPINLTEKEYDALISISGGNVEKMITDYLKEMAGGAIGKKKLRNIKRKCPVCGRMVVIYINGHKTFITSIRPEFA